MRIEFHSSAFSVGGHTREALREHGYSDAEINALAAEGPFSHELA